MNDTTAQPNKRALLIGINEYPNLPDYSQLRGCVNDVEAMSLLLRETFRFPPENIRVLRNGEATAEGIRAAMERLVAECAEGDIVVFHYSGHGSLMVAKGNKARGYDESIMPYDSGRMNPKYPVQAEPRDIRDTEIQEWLSRLTQKTSHLTLIFDSCHSGSITRLGDDSEAEGTRLRWIPPDPLPPSAAPGPAEPVARGAAREAGGSGWLPLSDKYVLLAACAAEQGAYELDEAGDAGPIRHGAMTFFLTRELSNLPDKSTYLDVWERVAYNVNSRFSKQTPLLEGARDRLIFGVEDIVPMRYLLVTRRQDGEAWLAGGAIHGLTSGSKWEVYPAGTKQLAGAHERRQGTLEITEVRPLTSKAKIVEESHPGAVAPNARAAEVLHVDAEARMPVWLAPAPAGYEGEVEGLKRALGQSELLKLSEAARGARAEVRIAPRAAGDADWQVLDRSEGPLMRPCPVGAAGSESTIRQNLESVWRCQKVLGLRNDRSTLRGEVDFTLLQKTEAGVWREVPADAKPVYKEGDSIAFRVTNRSRMSIYVSVLDIGLSHRIDVLHPPSSASEEIAVKRSGEAHGEAHGGAHGGGVLVVGTTPADEIELFFPDNLAFLTEAPGGGPARGLEFFKLVVTTQRHDLSFLRQGGLRKEPGDETQHPLERLLYLSTTGGPCRDARTRLEPQEEWLTEERAFWLERRG